MYNIFKIIVVAIISLFVLPSCDDLRDSYEDCGVWLEFIFDHNMDYADSFGENVGTVDVLVFDKDGKYYSSHFARVDELSGHKRLFMGDPDMPFGTYYVVTVGGLTDHFRLSDINGNDPVKGVTTIEQISHSLLSTDSEVSHEFPDLWFGRTVEIDYKADLSVWPVPIMRQTNTFSISTRHNVKYKTRAAAAAVPVDTPLHHFSIVAPESGAYDHENNPLDATPLTYRAQDASLASTVEDVDMGMIYTTGGQINTMRLMADDENGYKFAVHDYESGEVIPELEFDLIDLLSEFPRGNRPDGTPLPLQEYLDREGDWNILIIYNTEETIGTPGGRFTSISIEVNGWVVWSHDMGI